MSLQNERSSLLQQILGQFGALKKKNHFGGYCLCIDNALVGLVLDGQFYVRGCLFSRSYFESVGFERLVYSKRGIPLEMRYYQLPEEAWCNPSILSHIIELAYRSAMEETQQRESAAVRIKDLPNMNMAMERALGKIGIFHAEDLIMIGAKACFLKLKQHGKLIPSVKQLIGLAAAIEGCHSEVLPSQTRQELINWFNSMN